MTENLYETTLNKDAKIDTIYHMADIHIRILSRHDEYRLVFERLYDYLKSETNKKNALIVICGDILHSKLELSPECTDVTKQFIISLSTIMTVIVIAGNHDMNMANLQRLDSLTPILSHLDRYPIYYLKKTGVYHYGNITFGFTAVYDRILKASSFETDKKYKIALFHGTVHGAETDIGKLMNAEELTIDDFSGYDYVFLGDIHKYQYMDEDKTICYPGSLIQQNFGESLKNHGLVKWNLKNKTSEFINIDNDYGFVIINVEDGKITKSPTKFPSKPNIRIDYTNTTIQELKSIEEKLKSKYNVQKLVKLPKNVTTTDEEKAITKGKTSIEIAEEYLKIKDPELSDDKMKEILDLYKTFICDIIEQEEISGYQEWKIRKLTFQNMFSYRKKTNIIDFTRLNGIVGLLAQNGHGKSSIVDIIQFIIFDKCSRGGANEVINDNSDSFSCLLEFEMSNNIYVIEKKGKRNSRNVKGEAKSSVKVDIDYYKINKDGSSEKLKGEHRNDTNKKIKEYFGSYEDFVTMFVASQDNQDNTIDKAPSKNRDFFNHILKLNRYEDIYKKVREKRNKLDGQLETIETELENYKPKKGEKSVKELKKIIKALKKDIANHNKKIQRLDKHRQEAIRNIVKLDKLPDLKKIQQRETEIKKQNLKLEKEIGEKIEFRDSIEKKIQNLDLKNEEIIQKNHQKFIDEKNKIIAGIQDKIAVLTRKIKNITIQESQEELYKNYNIHLQNYKDQIAKINISKDKITKLSTEIDSEQAIGTNLETNKKKLDELIDIKDKYTQIKETIKYATKTLGEKKKRLEKCENHEYDPDCKYCVKNPLVVEMKQLKREIPELEKRSTNKSGERKGLRRKS